MAEIIELGKSTPIRPDDAPRKGDRRIVKLVPMPWGAYAQCLWRSPTTSTEDGQRGRWCIVLADRGDGNLPAGASMVASKVGRPGAAAMFVPDVIWDKLPDDVVEW